MEFLKLETVDDIDKEGFMHYLESLNNLDSTTKANGLIF